MFVCFPKYHLIVKSRQQFSQQIIQLIHS